MIGKAKSDDLPNSTFEHGDAIAKGSVLPKEKKEKVQLQIAEMRSEIQKICDRVTNVKERYFDIVNLCQICRLFFCPYPTA